MQFSIREDIEPSCDEKILKEKYPMLYSKYICMCMYYVHITNQHTIVTSSSFLDRPLAGLSSTLLSSMCLFSIPALTFFTGSFPPPPPPTLPTSSFSTTLPLSLFWLPGVWPNSRVPLGVARLRWYSSSLAFCWRYPRCVSSPSCHAFSSLSKRCKTSSGSKDELETM